MEILRFLEGIRSPFFDTLFSLVTRIGEETIAMIVICVFFWCINKRTAYIIGIAYFLSGLTVQVMKICFRIERPWVIDPAFRPVQSAIGNATGYSFPSGHTQSATTLFCSLGAQTKKKPLKAACLLAVVLVAFSRMYLGVHTLLDVAAAFFMSLLFVFLTVKTLADDSGNRKRELVLSLFIVLYSCAAIAIAMSSFYGGKIEQIYLSDCLKAAGAGVGFAAGMYVERIYINFSVSGKNVLWQVLKFILGIAGVLLIKEGLKLILGDSLAVDTVRYFLIVIWVTALFPLIIKRYFTAKAE